MADWTSLTDEELTEAEMQALDTALYGVTEYGAGTATMSGRNRHGEIEWSATVADVDGHVVGFVTRHGVDDDKDREAIDVVVAAVPVDAVVIPRSAIPRGATTVCVNEAYHCRWSGRPEEAEQWNALAALLSGATTEGGEG